MNAPPALTGLAAGTVNWPRSSKVSPRSHDDPSPYRHHPSGTPHLGNYVGAIRPAIAASRAPGIESFFFLADLHSLIKSQDPQRTQRATLEIAASWLACGLDPEHVWFYRQSDIRETTELMWFLTAIASKGILNRAHAYKAAVDKNREEGLDEDAGVSAGLFMYPVLMAADILIFKANQVPVGRDQIQHIEMARISPSASTTCMARSTSRCRTW